jgi:hypothetical protein
MKLVKTLQSKLAATTAATTALASDQGVRRRRFSAEGNCDIFAALLAASLEKLNAREKELMESKGFMEGKRFERVKEVSQLEDSLKTERA